MTTSPRSDVTEAVRVSVERLCGLVAAQRLEEMPAEQRELERALERVTAEVATLRAERDNARTEAARNEFHLAEARQVLEDGPDGYIVTDNAGIISHANRSAAQMLGVPLRFLVKKSLSLFIDESDLRLFRWRVNNARSRRQGEWPMRMRPRNGIPFTAGLTVAPFPGDEGERGELRWFLRDITARPRAEEPAAAQDLTNRMLESEQLARADAEAGRLRLELLAEVSSVLASTLDYAAALGRVAARVVPAAADVFITDVLAGQALEQVAMACIDASAAERLRKRRPPDPSGDHPIAAVIRTGEAMLVSEVPAPWRERWVGTPEERDLWDRMPLTSVVIVPIASHRQTHGALTFAFASERRYDLADLAALKDIGQRTALALDTARLFRDLEAEQHHRDEFLAMLAHELRNPLSAVTSGLGVLEQVDPVSRARLLEILGRQSRHLARLLNDLLDVSGVRFGRLVLDRQRLDLRELARDALDVVRTARRAVGPAIELRTDPEPVTVVGDADRLQQTIANLLDNAVKYTPSNGSIAVSVGVEDGDAVVRVRDTGAGIAPEFLPRIFDVFSRAGSSATPSRPGLGLGLSVVRELVVKHGGSVSADSPGVGRGSEFTVRLPLNRDADVPHAEETPAAPAERSILIVEDHPDACDGLRIVLSLKGHHVRAAMTGRDAIEETRVQPPEIALVDIGLPDIDGYEVGRIIRSQPGGEGVYLVALTGLSAPADVDNALRAGFDSYMVKPVDPEKLAEVIAHAHR